MFNAMIFADIVWPALFLEQRLLTWWAIGAGLFAEFFVLRFWLKLNTRVALIADFVMNSVSAIAGIVLIPVAGIVWEIIPGEVLYPLLQVGTFNPVTWVATCILAAIVNSLIEGVVLRLVFKMTLHKTLFVALFVGNTLSVALAMASILVSPPRH